MEQRFSQILACIGLCLLLAACSSGPEVPVCQTEGVTLAPKKATSRPYQINGVWYYPQPHYEYVEEGIASLYGGGDSFHGRPTATGERFSMNGMTAAHKTVPLPCMAKVTNLENGREIVVKVNDRGPFIPGRIIDISRRGAQLLGFEHKGLTKVRVETLVPESLALNGIDPSTVMLAKAPNPSATTGPVLLAAAPIVTTKLDAPDNLLEALKSPSSIDESPPSPEPVIMTEVASQEPLMIEESSLSASERMAETRPPSNPSPLPVKLEPVASTGIFVYVGEYETYAKAQSASRSLDGFADSPIGIIKNRGPQPYAACLGPLPSMSSANQVLDQLVNAGHLISRIVIQH